ncbi:MAG: hypothetical protein JXA15_02695 [Spirochaetales bacterium]|nr:hypothetical protein [Spirochaetales bacterium]
MDLRVTLKKSLALVGTLLAALPLIAPIALTIMRVAGGASFIFDYLMPAELFPLAIAGGLMILVAGLLSRRRRWLAIGSLAAAAIFFLGITVGAELTGLASGAHPATGWRVALLYGFLVLFVASEIAIVVGGILLARDLAREPAA